MSLVMKQKFIDAVEKTYKEFDTGFDGSYANKKLLNACKLGIKETRDTLIKRADRWMIPAVPSVKFIREISSTLWFHIYSGKFKHKFHNTVNMQKDEFLREVRFKLHGTRNL